jgi:hypothetical protein
VAVAAEDKLNKRAYVWIVLNQQDEELLVGFRCVRQTLPIPVPILLEV